MRLLIEFRYHKENYDKIVLNFLTAKQQAATFSWKEKRTLAQIEQISGYTVKPRGVVSQFKHGGFVVTEENGHGLVASIADFDKGYDWSSAKSVCDELILNGYDDWRLPTADELNALYINLKKQRAGGFLDLDYWSANEYSTKEAYIQLFGNGKQTYGTKVYGSAVRAVRTY